MQKWLLAGLLFISPVLVGFGNDSISFSPPLPSPWVVKSDKDISGKDATNYVVLIVNTNEACSITITVSQRSKQDAEKDFDQIGRSWCAGAVDGVRENDKLNHSKLTFKTVGGQKVAEATCTVTGKNGKFYGLCRCWLSGDRLVGWIAIGTRAPIENQKHILDITDSIKIAN